MTESSEEKFDFIVVGAGPAGCSLAYSLAKTKARPAVLLVEAGPENSDISLRAEGNKYIQVLNTDQTYAYKSVPNPELAGREIGLARGKGLGGSSGVNFTAWTLGSRDEWDAIASITNDDAWSWEQVQRRWKALENFHSEPPEVPHGKDKYLAPRVENHGYSGPLNIGFPHEWDYDLTAMMDVWEANGYSINQDLSSGNPIGISIVPTTCYRGVRVTASDLLIHAGDNIRILTDAPVHRVLFDGVRAIGVQLNGGQKLFAAKEVILSGGALDTPKILMHSGIGPAGQLEKFGVPVLQSNPAVGANYQDHYHISLKFVRATHTNRAAAFFRDPARQRAALREWQLYRTGDFATIGTGMVMGFFKSPSVYDSAEFKALPRTERERIASPTVPTYEIFVTNFASEYYRNPTSTPPLLQLMVFLHNSQGRGDARLVSADPAIPLEFRTAFLEHPYDQRAAIEGTREVLRVAASSAFRAEAGDGKCEWDGPDGDSDEEILDFWRKTCTSTWHMCGTCRMAREYQNTSDGFGAVVDTRFRVFGLDGLRVADMSVIPILPSCHTQSTAYQIGLLAAEKLIKEYGLEEPSEF